MNSTNFSSNSQGTPCRFEEHFSLTHDLDVLAQNRYYLHYILILPSHTLLLGDLPRGGSSLLGDDANPTVDVYGFEVAPLSGRLPTRKRGRENEVVVITLSPVFIGIMSSSQIDLPTKVQ
jgi:hypothetical protein